MKISGVAQVSDLYYFSAEFKYEFKSGVKKSFLSFGKTYLRASPYFTSLSLILLSLISVLRISEPFEVSCTSYTIESS